MSYSVQRNFSSQPVDEGQGHRMEKIRATAGVLAALILQNGGECRERSLALTNLEQAVFWANAGIAREGR